MDSIVDSFSEGSMRSTRNNSNEIAIGRCGWIDFANNEIIIIICKRREETRIKITMNLRKEEKYFDL